MKDLYFIGGANSTATLWVCTPRLLILAKTTSFNLKWSIMYVFPRTSPLVTGFPRVINFGIGRIKQDCGPLSSQGNLTCDVDNAILQFFWFLILTWAPWGGLRHACHGMECWNYTSAGLIECLGFLRVACWEWHVNVLWLCWAKVCVLIEIKSLRCLQSLLFLLYEREQYWLLVIGL